MKERIVTKQVHQCLDRFRIPEAFSSQIMSLDHLVVKMQRLFHRAT